MSGKEIPDWIERWMFTTVSLFALAHPEYPRKTVEPHFTKQRRDGRIKSFPLRARELGFILTSRECKERGHSRKRSQPPGAQSIVMNFGYQLHCLSTGTVRRTRKEIEENVPELLVPGLSADRYVHHGDGIGLLLCDCGSHPKHLARKVRKEWDRRRQVPAWREIQMAYGFTIIVIVGHEGRARYLRAKLRDSGIAFETFVYGQLSDLIVEKSQ